MTHQILVPFRGEGSGSGELSWGQRVVWRTIAHQGHSEYVGGVVTLPEGTTVDTLLAGLAYVLGRHQSLRTLLEFDADGEPHQVVFAEGELAVTLVEVGAADPDALADRIQAEEQDVDFDYAHEWPLRMTAVCRDGVPIRAIAVYNHLALDAHGLAVLVDDLTRPDRGLPVTATQPLEQARQQALPSAQRHTDGALRHWERALRAAPVHPFGESGDDREPRYWRLRYFSPAADRAIRLVAARHGTDTSPVLLAAYAVALATTVGRNPVVLQLAVSNRFRPGFAESVSPLAEASPCLLDVAGVPFDVAVGRAVRAAMSTYLNAYYDPLQRVALVARVNAERGEQVELGCYFNDRRVPRDRRNAPPSALDAPDSVLTWGPHTTVVQPPLYLDVNDADDGVAFTMTADTHHVSPAAMEAIVRTLERVVVQAAQDGRVSVGAERAPV